MKNGNKFTSAQKNLLKVIARKPLLYNIKLMKPIHPLCEQIQYRTFQFLQTTKLIELKDIDDTFNTYVLSEEGKMLVRSI
jgi:hypothetical protein